MWHRVAVVGSLLLAAACGSHDGGKTPAARAGNPPNPAGASSVPDARLADGPRITLSPDNVHIEYRVYGQGEPAVLLVHGWACDELSLIHI